ncbi:MAG: hypoxanthine phosphoribosyltransferase [Candidatus Phytoplasma sp.]|nr:hypoxanthine phosphoribosyltransferase [Phytoplasma sp.]
MHNDIQKVLVSEKEILEICQRLGDQISKDYQGKKPIFVGLLKGCVPFMSDLAKHISIHLEMAYMSVSSYHGGITSSGDVNIKLDLDMSIKNRDVIIVEDIVDTGLTLTAIVDLLKHRNAKSVKVVTLLDKPEGRKVPFVADYVGTVIPKEFVVGYGLDYDELYRNLPYVGVLKPEIYSK